MARRKPRQPVRRNPAEPINRRPVEDVIPPDLLDFLRALREQAGPQLDESFGGFEGSLPGMDRGVPGFLPGEGGPLVQRPIAPPIRRPFPGMGGGGPVDPGFNIQPDPPGFLPGEELGPMRPIAGPPQIAPGMGGFEGPLRGPPMRGFPPRSKPIRGFPHPSTYGGGFPSRRPF